MPERVEVSNCKHLSKSKIPHQRHWATHHARVATKLHRRLFGKNRNKLVGITVLSG